MDDRTYALPELGVRVLEALASARYGRVHAADLRELGARLGVPLKYVPRAVASVARLGIVTADLREPGLAVTIHFDRLAKRKIGLGQRRVRLPAGDREALIADSAYRCACCGRRFLAHDLVLDHLVPLSLLGADHPANLVPMSRNHNSRKWDRFTRGALRLYRRERVDSPLGVRFIDGAFWPVINGKVRKEKGRHSTLLLPSSG